MLLLAEFGIEEQKKRRKNKNKTKKNHKKLNQYKDFKQLKSSALKVAVKHISAAESLYINTLLYSS